MPLDEVTEDHCQAFMDRLTRMEPLRDEHGHTVWEDDDGNRIERDPKTGKRKQKGGRMVYVPGKKPLEPEGAKRVAASIAVVFEAARKKPYRYIKVNPWGDVEIEERNKDERTRRKSLTPVQAARLEVSLENTRETRRGRVRTSASSPWFSPPATPAFAGANSVDS